MEITSELERDFIKLDLGPTLEKAGYGVNTTNLMCFDNQRKEIQDWAKVILSDKDAAKYVSGTAVHWYADNPDNVINLDKTHEIDPSKYILMTEASDTDGVGNWNTFVRYADTAMTVCSINLNCNKLNCYVLIIIIIF